MNNEDLKEIEQMIVNQEKLEVGATSIADMIAIFHKRLTRSGIEPMHATLLTSVYLTSIINQSK